MALELAYLDPCNAALVGYEPENVSAKPHCKTVLVKNELVRLFYRAFLSSFTHLETQDFWKKHPLIIDGRALTEKEKFNYLWQDLYCPFDFLTGIAESFEGFLTQKGFDPSLYIRNSLLAGNNGCIFSPQAIITIVAPVLEKAFSYKDIREFAIDILELAAKHIAPGSYHQILSKTEANDTLTYVLQHSFGGKRASSLNAHIWLKQLISTFPAAMSAPDFNTVEIIAERATVYDILKKRSIVGARVQGDTFFFGNKEYGKVLRFGDFAHPSDPSDPEALEGYEGYEGYGMKGCKVIVLHEDLYAPNSLEPILYKCCAYGAPVYLSKVSFTRHKFTGNPFLNQLIALATPQKKILDIAEHLHTAFLASLTSKYSFTYKSQSATLHLNGKQIASKAPANILSVILDKLFTTGQSDFTMKDIWAHRLLMADFRNNQRYKGRRPVQGTEAKYIFNKCPVNPV